MTALEHLDLPYVDTHQIAIPASPDRVWAALRSYVDRTLTAGDHDLFGRLLDPQPRPGFEVAREVAGRQLFLSGRHRFSRYLLVFDLDVADGQALLSAHSYAEFPGLHGRLYRALVIGTRLHVLATRHMLASVLRLAEAEPA